MELTGQTIFILSNEPWGDIWYSKQNYAYELSKTNTVFFINPPKKWNSRNVFYNPIKTFKYSDSLYILNYQNFLPIINNVFNIFNNYLVTKYLLHFFKKKKITDFIFWSFDPIRLYNPRLFNPKLAIYHCVDLFFFKFIGEKIICENSDLIIGNSPILLNEYKSFNKPLHYIPHGISEDEFNISKDEQKNNDLSIENYGIYIGVIDERLDYRLIEKVVQQYPNIDFVFVGPKRYNKDNLVARNIFENNIYKNVHAVGPKHFKKLKVYISKAKFCISFMDKNYPGNTIAHHKTMIYLAHGKPIFGYKFSEYTQLEEIMYMGLTHEETIEQLQHFLENGESSLLSEKRIMFAKKFTFKQLISSINSILKNY